MKVMMIVAVMAMALAGPVQAQQQLPVYVPVLQKLWGLGEIYREICEGVGGEYFADPNLLRVSDVQYWRCEGGDWCGTYPDLPLCKQQMD